jgi:hypothetical protein
MPKGLKGFQRGNDLGRNRGQYKNRKSWNKGLKNSYKLGPMSEETKKKIGLSNSITQGGKPKPWLRKKEYSVDESRIWRSRVEYRLWREAVYSRDNWACQRCSSRGYRLHPHHILNFKKWKDLRFAIDNGVTLCVECHIGFHGKYGKKDNNKEQIIEWCENE